MDEPRSQEINMPKCSVCGTPLSDWEGECPSCQDQRRTADWGPEEKKADE